MPSSDENILVIRHGAFGDIVQTDGVFRDIRNHHPHADITLLTTPPFAKLMARCPHFDHVLVDERAPLWRIDHLWALRTALQRRHFYRVYDLQISDRTDLYRLTMFAKDAWCGRRVRTIPLIGKRILAKPGLARYVDQLKAAGIDPRHALSPDVSWMANDVSRLLDAEGVTRPYVALIPGCSAKHPHKRWPYYPELAKRLLDHGFDVVTAPGPDEIELARSVPGHTLLGPKGFLDWFDLAGVLKNAAFVVGNDTGPSHIASCLQVPGLALFGPHTSVERTGIKRGAFDAMEVADLKDLSCDTVLEKALIQLQDQSNSV